MCICACFVTVTFISFTSCNAEIADTDDGIPLGVIVGVIVTVLIFLIIILIVLIIIPPKRQYSKKVGKSARPAAKSSPTQPRSSNNLMLELTKRHITPIPEVHSSSSSVVSSGKQLVCETHEGSCKW